MQYKGSRRFHSYFFPKKHPHPQAKTKACYVLSGMMHYRFLPSLLACLLIACLSQPNLLLAQGEKPYTVLADIVKKKDLTQLYSVRQHLQLGNFQQAIEALTPLLTTYPTNIDLRYMRAEAYRLSHQYQEAAGDFQLGTQLAPDYKIEAFMDLGKLRHKTGEFAAAQSAYQVFLSRISAADPQYEEVRQLIRNAETAAVLAANPVPFEPKKLLGGVNTNEHHEYFPSISVDGQRLLFTRNVFKRNEDFYEAFRQADGSWSEAQPLEAINSDYDEAAQTLSADGNLIVFTSCGQPKGLGSCDLYYVEKINGRWSQPKNMGPNINSPQWDSHPALSADGKLLFFASTRPGGLGASDLWGAARNADGQWSKAVNLGPTLNTKGKDEFPFLHPDGRTLYFTSNGHPGMGDMDIFQVQLGNDNRWSEPRNLGYPINTPGEETNLVVNLAGTEAFFAKRNGSAQIGGVIDIYAFTLPEAVRPIPSTFLAAEVVDASSGQPLVAEVRFRALDQELVAAKQQSANNGNFLIVLPAGHTYALSVELAGYLPYTHTFDLQGELNIHEPYRLRIALTPTTAANTAKDPIILHNVTFAFGTAELLPASFAELDRLANLLENSSQLRIAIEGHTDNIGSQTANQLLSENRAKAVYDYLLLKGIPPQRLTYAGYAASQPIADNASEAGRAQNRRTAFRILE